MRVTSLGFRTDLGVGRLDGAEIQERDAYIVVRTPANPAYWWGNYLLLPGRLARGSAQRVRSIFRAEFPAAAHLAVGIDGTDGNAGDAAEVASLGVKVEVNTVLSAARLRLPERGSGGTDRTFRTLTTDDDWEQAVDLRLAVYPEHESPDDRVFVRRQLGAARAMCDSSAAAWFGAFIEGRLVASLGLVAVEPGLARYQSVETHPDYRRQGLASRLLDESSRYGRQRLGAHRLVIVADPKDEAIRLYRALGFDGQERQVQLQREPQ
jgi:ribosomal protein S18 acetylase RimI-like enzyme